MEHFFKHSLLDGNATVRVKLFRASRMPLKEILNGNVRIFQFLASGARTPPHTTKEHRSSSVGDGRGVASKLTLNGCETFVEPGRHEPLLPVGETIQKNGHATPFSSLLLLVTITVTLYSP